jgi:hypothetical protein
MGDDPNDKYAGCCLKVCLHFVAWKGDEEDPETPKRKTKTQNLKPRKPPSIPFFSNRFSSYPMPMNRTKTRSTVSISNQNVADQNSVVFGRKTNFEGSVRATEKQEASDAPSNCKPDRVCG